MKKIIVFLLLLFFLRFSSPVWAWIPGGAAGRIYAQLPDGTKIPLPGVKIFRVDWWQGQWTDKEGVETTSDINGNYIMDNDNNNPGWICKNQNGAKRCLTGEQGKIQPCKAILTNNCPDDQYTQVCADPPMWSWGLNWCGFNCGRNPHRWWPYFPQGYHLPGNLEGLGYSHLRGRWEPQYREENFANSEAKQGRDFIFILDPPLTPTPTSTPTPTPTNTPTPTPYLVIKVKDVNGNSRLAEKMALTYSCPGVSFCKQGEDVTLKSEYTFPYSGGSNKGGGIVVRSFHQLLGVTPIPNTGGSLRAMSVPCNGINCSEIWQNYWWNNFPNTGQASLDYVVYVYPTPSLGSLIIKADDTEDSTSGPYGFSGMRREDSGIVNKIAQFGRNQYNYLVVGQVINSNIQSSQNLNPDPKANIGLGGVIFGPREPVSFNPNDPASILRTVRDSKGFIMLYSEKSISTSERKHLLRNSNIKIEKDHFYFYVPTDNNFTSYQWVKMRKDTRLPHKVLSNNKEVFILTVAESMRECYDNIDEKTLVPCFKLYFYSGFLSNQEKKIHEWGTYGYVYDHLRDQNFIEKKDPNQN